jgi:hypothetical protein
MPTAQHSLAAGRREPASVERILFILENGLQIDDLE